MPPPPPPGAPPAYKRPSPEKMKMMRTSAGMSGRLVGDKPHKIYTKPLHMKSVEEHQKAFARRELVKSMPRDIVSSVVYAHMQHNLLLRVQNGFGNTCCPYLA